MLKSPVGCKSIICDLRASTTLLDCAQQKQGLALAASGSLLVRAAALRTTYSPCIRMSGHTQHMQNIPCNATFLLPLCTFRTAAWVSAHLRHPSIAVLYVQTQAYNQPPAQYPEPSPRIKNLKTCTTPAPFRRDGLIGSGSCASELARPSPHSPHSSYSQLSTRHLRLAAPRLGSQGYN